MKTIGERIKERREQLKISQDELAQKLGYKSRSSINKIESGDRNLTQSKIKAIADALSTTPGYIMGWDNAANPATRVLGQIIDYNFENGGSSKFAEFLIDTTKDTPPINNTNINKETALTFEMSHEEKEFIERFRLADDSTKDVIVRLLAFAVEQENKNHEY